MKTKSHCHQMWLKNQHFNNCLNTFCALWSQSFWRGKQRRMGKKSSIVLLHSVAIHTLRHTNTKLKREINFRHVVEPLNLLILMAEVFFSLCFFSFLFSWLLWVGLGPRLPGRHSDEAIYLSTSVASAPLSFPLSLPPAILDCFMSVWACPCPSL